MPAKTRAELRAERDAALAERDAALKDLATCEQALADCQDVEPPPPPPTGDTGVTLPDGQKLHVEPPVGPFTPKDGGSQTPWAPQGVNYTRGTLVPGPAPAIRKIKATRHNRDNIAAMAWLTGEGALPVDPPLEIEDCIAEDALNTTNAAPGTTESNFWVGCSAHVQRIEGKRADWMGMFTGGSSQKPNGGCYRSLIEHFRLTEQRIGVYLEHTTRETTFRNFWIEAARGINVEWWYGQDHVLEGPTVQGSHSCVIRDGYIKVTGPLAISLDYGTSKFRIENLVIPSGAIELPNGLVDPTTKTRHHRRDRPDLDNVVSNCKRPDGSAVPVIYHSRGAP